MVPKPRALALVPALIIVCLILENSNARLCPNTSEAALFQMKQLIMHIENPTKRLYESYLDHQSLHSTAAQACQRNISWFPKRDITKKTGSMLRRLHKTLEHMNNSLTVIREQQRDLQQEDASLHKDLKMAQQSVKGLLQNTNCALSLRGQTPASIPPLTRPADRTAFEVKTDGCQVLWNYWQFISHLSQGFKSRQPEGAGPPQPKKRCR